MPRAAHFRPDATGRCQQGVDGHSDCDAGHLVHHFIPGDSVMRLGTSLSGVWNHFSPPRWLVLVSAALLASVAFAAKPGGGRRRLLQLHRRPLVDERQRRIRQDSAQHGRQPQRADLRRPPLVPPASLPGRRGRRNLGGSRRRRGAVAAGGHGPGDHLLVGPWRRVGRDRPALDARRQRGPDELRRVPGRHRVRRGRGHCQLRTPRPVRTVGRHCGRRGPGAGGHQVGLRHLTRPDAARADEG